MGATTSELKYTVTSVGEHFKVSLGERVIASFKEESEAYQYVTFKNATPADLKSMGERACRADYWQDVRDTAESIEQELESRLRDQECGEGLREWLIKHIDKTVDGSSRVIYTASAIECLLYSDNDGAYFDDFGAEGAVDDGGVQWSKLAYCAFRQDVMEQLEANCVDLNAPVPECNKCGEDDQNERYEQDGLWLCESCHEEATAEKDEDAEGESTHASPNGAITERQNSDTCL